jgi:hypothetical protein
MNRKFIVAILLIAAVPVCAHAQNPKVSKGDAQKAVIPKRDAPANTINANFFILTSHGGT